jgi:hypothetical protein
MFVRFFLAEYSAQLQGTHSWMQNECQIIKAESKFLNIHDTLHELQKYVFVDEREIGVRFPAGLDIFIFCAVSRPASGLIQPPMDTDAFSLGGNGTGA